MKACWLLLVVSCLGLACAHPEPPRASSSLQKPARPRLVVQLTIDQLRADLLTRYADRYGEGGLRRFLDAGTTYERGYYAHAITETAVGHATLFTGALPTDHGIVGNEWFDLASKKPRVSVQDPDHHVLSRSSTPSTGVSPRALRVTTIGDELVLGTNRKALVFAVSAKDRGAILPGGHAGKAFWYEDASGDFVTSDYYYRELPAWVSAYEAAHPQDQYRGKTWDLLEPRQRYVHAAEDDRPFEQGYKHLGRTFPHPLDGATSADTYKALKRTPMGDELTLSFVEALLAAEPLGRDEVPDLLSISFSSTDYVGHQWGPESLEAEDNLLRLDRTIARLFDDLLRIVPEPELVVLLSADHGTCESPEALTALGIDAGRHDPAALIKLVNAGLEQRFGAGSAFVLDFVNPALWLDEAAIAQKGLVLEDVERAAAALVLAQPGIAYAIPKIDLERGTLREDPVHRRVLLSFDRERTGHVYIVPKTGWLQSSDAADLTAMHGTPWDYDRLVPIAFWGASVRARRIRRPVDPRDIAPTLAELLGVKPPSGSTGQPLFEVLSR